MKFEIIGFLLLTCVLVSGCTSTVEPDVKTEEQQPQKSLILYYSRSGNTLAVARYFVRNPSCYAGTLTIVAFS